MRGGVGAGGRKEKPHNPLMISVQKVRMKDGGRVRDNYPR